MKKSVLIFGVLILLILPLINSATAPIIVYKTKGDYSNLVMIGLSENKTLVTSYPIISYAKEVAEGERELFTKLEKGYLLDKFGIQDVFLDMTWEEYGNLEKRPSNEEFLEMIKYIDPYLEMYDCNGKCVQQYDKTLAESCNELISKNELETKCKVIIKKEIIINETPCYVYFAIGLGIILVLVILILILKRRKEFQ